MKIVALVLAGGEGSRLHPLTADHAKPALLEASALNPSRARSRALPRSQGLGMTKQPDA